MDKKIRVRFAPSPTGGLHLGGVRTVLFNYLFAKKNGGEFILRIEDTDQTRFVEGAEAYIYQCLEWCGLTPDESPKNPGKYGPYKQSERKAQGLYQQYADQLVEKGYAYLAFDTPEELEKMRQDFKTDQNPSPQYDATMRRHMRNSISLTKEETEQLLADQTPYVVRIKMPENETVSFIDSIRGEVHFETNLLDDKVLLKRDGMPTYHLAVVVDDFLMEITHAFRGEEWLPSAPIHILLWKYLFGIDKMPEWAHLPLILGPHGKLSKRDGAKYGFPVFAMDWTDKGELVNGFKEMGFLPEAFINLLAMLGWNNGTEQEIFSKDELISAFSIKRIHSAGAKFDWEKAKWFNHEWIKKMDMNQLTDNLIEFEPDTYKPLDKIKLSIIVGMVRDRCHLLSDFWKQLSFFFEMPQVYNLEAIVPKWSTEKKDFFNEWCKSMTEITNWQSNLIENSFKELSTVQNLKMGELQLPLRIMLVGDKYGPNVFDIAALLGKDETIKRIQHLLTTIENKH